MKKKPTRIDEILLEEVVCLELNIPNNQITHLYNLGKPTMWYVTLQSEVLYMALHMREISMDTSICSSILFLHLDKNGQRGHLKWVPPTFHKHIVENILKTVSQTDEPLTAFRQGNEINGRWTSCPSLNLKLSDAS